ncbi:MAG: hypothetical protein WA183_14830 [Chthoniobacterales bacterium]
MKTIVPRIIFIGAIVGAVLITALPQIRADDFDDAEKAVKDCEQATKDAQDNVPVKSVRDAENKLDQAEQKLDDVNSKTNPTATDLEKKDAQTERDDAQKAADDAQAAGNPDLKGKYDKYRDALKRRREACKKLKKLIPDLQAQVSKQAHHLSDNIVNAHKNVLRKASDCVKKCGEPPAVAMVMPGVTPGGPTLASLASTGRIAVSFTGTGETIGPVAMLTLQNLTDEPINCAIPPMVLESGSRKNQDYVCPKGQSVAIGPHGTATVPMDGVCVNRSKPPVGKGVGGDLVMNDGNPNVPANANSHVSPRGANKLLGLCTAKYDAVDKLQKDGTLKDLPYKDKQKQKDICVQWSTWSDPRICEITGAQPATKDDLKKVVYKQVEEQGPLTPDKKKKIDQGIDTIFDKIELTSEKAKDLEKPESETIANESETPAAGSAVNISNQTPTPAPQTQEKPKKKKPKLSGDRPKPVRDWWDKLYAMEVADVKKQQKEEAYTREKNNYFDKSKHHQELVDKVSKIQAILSNPLSKNTAVENDKLIKERNELQKELAKLEADLEKDFRQTDEGKKALQEMGDAQQAANDAHKAEAEAGKYIDKEAIGHAVVEQLQKNAADQAKADQAVP